MKHYSLVYNSQTGNTVLLAEQIKKLLPEEAWKHFGAPSPAGADADFIFAGFWTDKGDCPKDMADFLESLQNKTVFLFGTAGFGGEEAYYQKILARVKKHLASSNQIAGTFMCQGKMPPAVRSRYVQMLEKSPEDPHLVGMVANFDQALSHPDSDDMAKLTEAARAALNGFTNL
ncbi:MAG: flavodoxin family protein BilS [Blautia sp.]